MGRWDGLHRPQSTWLAEFTGCRSQRGFTWFTFGWFSWCLFYFFYSIFYSVYLLLFLNFILNCFGFMKNFPFPSGSKQWTKTDTGNGNDDVRNHVTSICATYCLSQLIHSKYLLCSSHGWTHICTFGSAEFLKISRRKRKWGHFSSSQGSCTCFSASVFNIRSKDVKAKCKKLQDGGREHELSSQKQQKINQDITT